jgi:hypothetical protein
MVPHNAPGASRPGHGVGLPVGPAGGGLTRDFGLDARCLNVNQVRRLRTVSRRPREILARTRCRTASGGRRSAMCASISKYS